MKDTLMAYSSKFAKANPQVLNEILEKTEEKDAVWTQNHINLMKEKEYPFEEIKGFKRFLASYVYVAL